MNPRYQIGGDIYAKLAAQYGTSGADRVALADASGVQGATATALGEVKWGATGSDSIVANFFNQITTDPLAAPLESANNQIGNAVLGVLKNPWVLLAVAAVVFFQLGGWNWLRKQFA